VIDKHADALIILANSDTAYSHESIAVVQRFINLFALASFRMQAEEALREAKLKAEESDRLKSLFLSNMSHDLRTPMNAIVGFAEMLQDAELGRDEKDRFLDAIIKSGDSLLHLVNDIIDISKIEAGQMQLVFSDCDVNALMDEIELTFRQELDRQGKTHVMLYIQKGIPDTLFKVHTDAIRIKQILSNLIGNAIKFTDEGFIETGYRIDSGKLLFYVRDSGIGIPEEYQKLVFERFGQVKETVSRNISGTGLGLTISKNLVEMLGGKIWLDSFPDEGSTFWFTLPLKKIQANTKLQAMKSSGPHRPDLSDKCILVVEDVDTNYFYISSLLEKMNARVIRAANGRRAVEMCKTDSSINLVLMDIELPVLNGYEATREIKKHRPGLPVIAQTAFAMAGERERSEEAGCDEYLAKPIRKDDLIETISRFIS
jgi:signal transduction histidine kinase/CheY-like chemotaxis protein